MLSDEERNGMEILTVMGHGHGTYTMEEIAAGQDTLQTLREAVGQALYGAAITVKKRREASATANQP